ncbi:MAG: phasin family protein [Acetobacteraceae bacterium]|nr:phasin family protein [Acetobacteraceae bacterium]
MAKSIKIKPAAMQVATPVFDMPVIEKIAAEPIAMAETVSPAAPTPETAAIPADATTRTQMETKMEKITQTTEELVSFSQANVEAMVKSSQIWAAGVQDIGKTFAATAQAQMDATMATLKAFTGLKSFKDAIELQTTLARSSVEAAVAETGKLTDASMKLAEQTFAPITARVNVAMEKFGKAA